jgi:hypothetical protein
VALAVDVVRVKEYVAAAFTGLWVQSHEHDDAVREIARPCRDERWALATWDVDGGLQLPNQAAPDTASDPIAAVKAANALATPDWSALSVLPNFRRFVQRTEVVQALATRPSVHVDPAATTVDLGHRLTPDELAKPVRRARRERRQFGDEEALLRLGRGAEAGAGRCDVSRAGVTVTGVKSIAVNRPGVCRPAWAINATCGHVRPQ